MNKDLKKALAVALGVTLWLRIMLFIIAYSFASRISPFPPTTNQMDYSYNISHNSQDPWFFIVQPLDRFDALWYQEIAIHNYKDQPRTTAFFPLYTWVVNGFSFLLHIPYLVTAFFVNTILTFFVFFLLYDLTKKEYDERVAQHTVILYAFFPVSFFLLVPYAEALLFVLTLLALRYAQSDKIVLSIIAASLAAATKPYGIAIIFPLAFVFLRNVPFNKKLVRGLFLLPIVLSCIAVLLFQIYQTGNNFAFFRSENSWHMSIPLPWEPILNQFQLFLHNPLDLPRDFYLLLIIGIIWFLIYSWKRIKTEYWLMTVVYTCIFYFFSYRAMVLSSFARYMLILFPVFMFLASLKVNNLVKVLYLSTSVVLLVLFFVYYTFGFFVG